MRGWSGASVRYPILPRNLRKLARRLRLTVRPRIYIPTKAISANRMHPYGLRQIDDPDVGYQKSILKS